MKLLSTSALLLAALVGAPLAANATPVTLNYSGTCAIMCGAIGLSAGDAVSGFVSTIDGLDGDSILDAAELSDFGFTFGTLSITSATHSAIGALDIGGALLHGLRFESNAELFGIPVSAVNTVTLFGLSGWTARPNLSLNIAAGLGSYDTTSVPEPGTLSLLGAGLVALGFARRRAKPAA